LRDLEICGVREITGVWNTFSNMSTALTIVVDKHSESRRQHLPDAAAVNYLLGKLWVSYGGSAEAIDYFVEALRLNPFLWDAFSDLCSTGKFCKRSSHCYAHK
jgi:hypothetical protein